MIMSSSSNSFSIINNAGHTNEYNTFSLEDKEEIPFSPLNETLEPIINRDNYSSRWLYYKNSLNHIIKKSSDKKIKIITIFLLLTIIIVNLHTINIRKISNLAKDNAKQQQEQQPLIIINNNKNNNDKDHHMSILLSKVNKENSESLSALGNPLLVL